MSIKAIIIDDERLAREGLKQLLIETGEIELVGEAANADEAIDLVEKYKPQLLFLDIEMPEKNGFDLLEELIETPFVIFTTAYNEFALKAFEVNAMDYLLKPIELTRLKEAIVRVKKQILEVDQQPKSNRNLSDQDHVFIRDGDKCWFVKLADIRLIESAGNYAKLYFHFFRTSMKKKKIEGALTSNSL
jgi:two-component system LytT family response regulator